MDTAGAGQDPDLPENATDEKSAKKKTDRERKKGEKKIDQYMKSISNLTPDEKIEALCKRNTDCYETIRTYKGSVQLLQRRIQVIEREKVQLQNDQGKTVLAKSRLETLCRELQRQNKSIKDESLQTIREEEEKRKEMSNRFQTALNEVTQMMQQNTDKNLKLREDNILISHKFQTLCEQFKQREEEVIRLSKQMDLEKQLADATVKRIECELSAEKEMWKKEKGYLLEQLKFSEEERLKLKSNISNLEEHLSMYSTRYEEFETTITKSNKVFDSYKVEMARLGKQVNKLENDCHSWQERWIQSQQQLTRAQVDAKAQEVTLVDREKKLNQLSSLCRSIQEERSTFLKQLKEHGIKPIVIPLPVPPPLSVAPVPATPDTKTSQKMTKKEKELSKLKKQVNALESQLVGTFKIDRDYEKIEKARESHKQETITETTTDTPRSADGTSSIELISVPDTNSSVDLISDLIDTTSSVDLMSDLIETTSSVDVMSELVDTKNTVELISEPVNKKNAVELISEPANTKNSVELISALIDTNTSDPSESETIRWPNSNSPDIIDLSMEMSTMQIIESMSHVNIDFPEEPNSLMSSTDQPSSINPPIKIDYSDSAENPVKNALKCALREIAITCQNSDLIKLKTNSLELTKTESNIIPAVKENCTDEKNSVPISANNKQNSKDQANKLKTKGKNSKKKNKK